MAENPRPHYLGSKNPHPHYQGLKVAAEAIDRYVREGLGFKDICNDKAQFDSASVVDMATDRTLQLLNTLPEAETNRQLATNMAQGWIEGFLIGLMTGEGRAEGTITIDDTQHRTVGD